MLTDPLVRKLDLVQRKGLISSPPCLRSQLEGLSQVEVTSTLDTGITWRHLHSYIWYLGGGVMKAGMLT